MRVLLVESNTRIASAYSGYLQAEGAVVEQAGTGKEALDLLRRYDFDLALLSLALSDTGGVTLISRMRGAGHAIPVLAFSGRPNPQTRREALSAGADDVVDQGIDQSELLARMNAILRRSRGHSQPQLRVGALTLDIERGDASIHGARVPLTNKEYTLLQLLVMRKNVVLTKETILSHLYGGLDEPEIKIIDVFICKIRKKLEHAGAPNVISTVWGRGYSVNDDRRDNDAPASPSVPQPTRLAPLTPVSV